MCRSQTFSSVEFLLIKLLSVSVIRKTMRNAARGGREVPILSFLCRAAFGALRPPGLGEAGFYPILAKERKRWRAKSQGWGKFVARSSSGDFEAELALLRHTLHPLLPRQPLASDISVKRYPEPPLLPPPPFSSLCPFFLFFTPSSFPLYVNSEKMTGNNVPVCSTLHWGPFLLSPDSRMTESCFIVQRFSEKRTFILPNNTRMGNGQTVSALFPAATQTAAGESLMGSLCCLSPLLRLSLSSLALASVGCLWALQQNAPEISCSDGFNNSTFSFS